MTKYITEKQNMNRHYSGNFEEDRIGDKENWIVSTLSSPKWIDFDILDWDRFFPTHFILDFHPNASYLPSL